LESTSARIASHLAIASVASVGPKKSDEAIQPSASTR
jgi:hypothetical protein